MSRAWRHAGQGQGHTTHKHSLPLSNTATHRCKLRHVGFEADPRISRWLPPWPAGTAACTPRAQAGCLGAAQHGAAAARSCRACSRPVWRGGQKDGLATGTQKGAAAGPGGLHASASNLCHISMSASPSTCQPPPLPLPACSSTVQCRGSASSSASSHTASSAASASQAFQPPAGSPPSSSAVHEGGKHRWGTLHSRLCIHTTKVARSGKSSPASPLRVLAARLWRQCST